MIVTADLVQQVLLHAQQERPRECCGFVINEGGVHRYLPCRNILGNTEETKNDFAIHPDDASDAEDRYEIVGVAHSHVLIPPNPTMADLVCIEESQLPWLIVNWPNGSYRVVEPSGFVAPLEGRTYTSGVLDCYTLVRDYYSRVLQITVNVDRDRDWRSGVSDDFAQKIGSFGFSVVKDLRIHDVIVIRTDVDKPPHFAVYLGEGKILHHAIGRYSSVDFYGTFWKNRTVAIARHKSLLASGEGK